jgi:protein-S-isoprenylcysteine O-methyltransferase Ste14
MDRLNDQDENRHSMKHDSWLAATSWEFENRALALGVLFSVAFMLSAFDPQNATVALAHALSHQLQADGDRRARTLFALAAVVVSTAALTRTWASAYLKSDVVYASALKTSSLVADGPYRHTRNPLYLGNVLMAVGMGAMASRIGFVVLVGGMIVFSYRLIWREEAELLRSQGEPYAAFLARVPRLMPAVRPRVPAAGRRPDWAAGFRAESWYWGFAAAIAAFAITLSVKLFFGILSTSLALFWVLTSRVAQGRG